MEAAQYILGSACEAILCRRYTHNMHALYNKQSWQKISTIQCSLSCFELSSSKLLSPYFDVVVSKQSMLQLFFMYVMHGMLFSEY